MRYVLPTVLAMAGTAAAVATLTTLASSAIGVMMEGSSDATMVVLAKGARTEARSAFSLEQLGQLKVAPGVAQQDASPLVSPEYVGSVWIDEVGARITKSVRIRGVDAIAFQLHPSVHLLSGRMPRDGELGVVVGSALLGRFAGLAEGGALRLGRHEWPVLGVLGSENAFASEIWGDRKALMDEFRHPSVSDAFVRVDEPGSREAFVEGARRIKGLDAIPEPELARRRMKATGMNDHVTTLRVFCALLAFGAVFAALNTLHGSLQSRRREFATLLAMGFGRRRVLLLVLEESLVIAVTAAIIGLPFALLFEGKTFVFGSSLFYSLHFGWTGLLVGLGTMAIIGAVGGMMGMVQMARLNVLKSLREN